MASEYVLRPQVRNPLSSFVKVGASGDASGFLLAAGGLLTASHSQLPFKELDPQVLSRPEYRNFLLFLLLSLLFPRRISRIEIRGFHAKNNSLCPLSSTRAFFL
jgi:hypothetical protein